MTKQPTSDVMAAPDREQISMDIRTQNPHIKKARAENSVRMNAPVPAVE